MSRAVRKVVSFLAYFGTPALVLACAYQHYRLAKEVRSVEQQVDQLILDVETDNAARAIRKALQSHSATHGRMP